MPTLTEKIDSREWTTGDRPAVTLHYLLAGVADDLTAKALLTSSTASSYHGLERGRVPLGARGSCRPSGRQPGQ